MKQNIRKRVEKLEKKIIPKSDWTKEITTIYLYEGKEYKTYNPDEKGTMTIIGMNPEAI